MNKRSGQASREKIVNAARRVFSEYGYKSASMRMIAKNAGISLGGLYLYFRNKEDLYTTLIKKGLDDLTREMQKTLKGIEDPADGISTFITMRVNYAKKHRENILVLGREQGFTVGIKVKKRFFMEQRRVVEEIIRKGVATGKFRQCDEKEVAKVIICALRGFILSIIVEPDALFDPEECIRLILRGLLAKD